MSAIFGTRGACDYCMEWFILLHRRFWFVKIFSTIFLNVLKGAALDLPEKSQKIAVPWMFSSMDGFVIWFFCSLRHGFYFFPSKESIVGKSHENLKILWTFFTKNTVSVHSNYIFEFNWRYSYLFVYFCICLVFEDPSTVYELFFIKTFGCSFWIIIALWLGPFTFFFVGCWWHTTVVKVIT